MTAESLYPIGEAKQIDKMYYKIILARDSITIQSSPNVGIK
jgi:hypothetical protein